MSQKNPVFKKLAALTLSASVCTTVVGATTPSKKKEYNSGIIKYAGCPIVAVVVIGTATYLAWAKLFVNKVLTAAENLEKELNKQTTNEKKVKKLSMEFYKLLHKANGETIDNQQQQSGDAFGEGNYQNYDNPATCKQAALELIEKTLTSNEELVDEEINDPQRKVKVNRLRYVDREKLKTDLDKMFQTEEKEEEEDQKEKEQKNEGENTTENENK